ncbi:aminotransferase class I/II-fold pyridoxal phosphate-dependent enzyme [Mycobacterium heidelbergense]|uniref:aminotransferase class I/II-fold pyridoxal phosphate-dependent enzyme n=1 Tax=Mycobacterium heidelbergense TaxID=53376 RepID=UPI003CEC0F34
MTEQVETSPWWAAEPSAARYLDSVGTPQDATPYLAALRRFAQRQPARFHAPAHKGGAGADPALVALLPEAPLTLDVRAGVAGIDGGTGHTPLDQAEELAAAAYAAKRTWFLTNGASQGIHAACLAGTHPGQSVLVQRDSHVSVISGLVLSGARPSYLQPEFDPRSGLAIGVSPERLRAQLAANPNVTAVILTAPSYFGGVGRIAECVDVARMAGVVVIVDQSWGAHFGFHERLPPSALQLGADIVVTSTHKSLGSLTQSAMLHLGHESPVPAEAIQRALTLVSSTSPSALLRASLDIARRRAATEGATLLERTLHLAEQVRRKLGAVPGCTVLGAGGSTTWDPLRVVVDLGGIDCHGLRLAAQLRHECDLHVALATRRHLVAVLGLQEPEEPLLRLGEELATRLTGLPRRLSVRPADPMVPVPGRVAVTPRCAYLASTETVDLPDATGRIAAATVCCYPPGTLLIAPGETVLPRAISAVLELREAGHRIQGLDDKARIHVVSAKANP